jgi:glycosyltransferase involved in cell wall biosynthesis
MTKETATDQPMVSVCIPTYNHEHYISECIESILMQRTKFKFEIIIGEDCSTDNTRAIVQRYEEKYPGIVNAIYHQQNVGSQRNAYEFCRPLLTGKYVAICEGDDYWIDPYKLQKQVTFLEQHPEYVLCFHPYATVDENSKVIKCEDVADDNIEYDLKSLLQKHISTMSVVFRNCIRDAEVDMSKAEYGDIFLFSLLSAHGKVIELNFLGGCYRKHSGGSYSGRSMEDKYRGTIETRKAMTASPLFNDVQRKEIEKIMACEKKRYVKNLIKHGEISSGLKLWFS